MSLALRIGCTLGDLCARMSAYEFALWSARNRIDPIDEDHRADVRAAFIQRNAALWAGKVLKPSADPALEDFMPTWIDPLAPPDPEPQAPDPAAHFAAQNIILNKRSQH